LLIQKGASLTMRDSEKRTPFSICLSNHNEDLLKKLLEGVTVNNDPEIFH
jgi:ankyrin repeat protein